MKSPVEVKVGSWQVISPLAIRSETFYHSIGILVVADIQGSILTTPMDPGGAPEPGLGKVLWEDVKKGGFFSDLREETRDIRDFYINQDKRDELLKMGRVKRAFVLTWWILKSMFLKLTPARRILLVGGLVLIFSARVITTTVSHGPGVSIEYEGLRLFLGLAAIILVLMLELKDKLLAHSELQAGRAVQKAMHPERAPLVPGWSIWLFTRPANEVGGDLVDFMKLNDERFAVTVGDVAGKGLGAALLMVKIQATLRALAPDFESLEKLARKVNEILTRDSIPSRFASLLFVHLSSGSGMLRYVNAGHMPPLVVRPSGVEEMEKGEPALGLSAGTAYVERDVQLSQGESFVLYSDGIIDAQSPQGEFFGVERFKTLCGKLGIGTPQSVGERIVSEVELFAGGPRGNDDVSLAILQRSS